MQPWPALLVLILNMPALRGLFSTDKDWSQHLALVAWHQYFSVTFSSPRLSGVVRSQAILFQREEKPDTGGPVGFGEVVFLVWTEKQDVHAFLMENLTNGGVLELMMRYLKSMGHKFLLKWPPGLADVVLSVYHSWRRHSTSLPNPLLRDCCNTHIKVGAS